MEKISEKRGLAINVKCPAYTFQSIDSDMVEWISGNPPIQIAYR